jgi:hypothetical protein
MKEQVTIIPIRITKAGQQYSFQHRLLRSAEKITGIETGVTMRSPVPQLPGHAGQRIVQLGTLWLQADGKANHFYSTDIKITKSNIIQTGFLKSIGTKKEKDPVDIPGCSIISGIYRDGAGLLFNNPVHYHINIYVWTLKRQA